MFTKWVPEYFHSLIVISRRRVCSPSSLIVTKVMFTSTCRPISECFLYKSRPINHNHMHPTASFWFPAKKYYFLPKFQCFTFQNQFLGYISRSNAAVLYFIYRRIYLLISNISKLFLFLEDNPHWGYCNLRSQRFTNEFAGSVKKWHRGAEFKYTLSL